MRTPVVPSSAAPASVPGRGSRGFSLPEMLVASAVFMLVMLAAYQAFQRSNESYRAGQNQAEMIQGARVAFEQMTNDIRLAGFEFDIDGEKERYPGQPDEQVEFMHPRAMVIRANFDFDKEFKGREPGLEFVGSTDVCCPIVTTKNEEIVGFALGKPSGTLPTGNIVFDADTTGTEDTLDEIRRDAIVEADGDIVNEETVTIPNVELTAPGATGYAPPYTLYRFQLNEDGSVLRQPFIDNVYSLEFTYYDEDGDVIVGPSAVGTQDTWGADNNKDKEAGRLTRWGVRRIKVRVETMTPDTDLRLKARGTNTGVRNFQGRRMFTLEADILPPNLGRRGTRDRDINPPEPPRNVEICTGECNMVRVSWDPGPPEDKVADHVVTLCIAGPCEEDGSNVLTSFIVIANFDVSQMQEYAVFTREMNAQIQEGVEIWADVVARNISGTESECPVQLCDECCRSQAGAIVGERSRPDTFESAIGGGYDPASDDFPDAWPDNSGGMVIQSDPLLPHFPPSLVSTVSLTTPVYALNKSGAAGTAPSDWTTKSLGGGSVSPMDCHQQESTPWDPSDDPSLRTPYNSFPTDSSIGNTYIWRVSGDYDNGTWGGAPNARSFAPTAENLLDFRHLSLGSGSTTYLDESKYVFTSTSDGDRYDGVLTNWVNASSEAPVRAVTPCEVYYYRFRAVSICWEDFTNTDTDPDTPPNGVRDAPDLPAWAHASLPGVTDYRSRARSISPFYPPMLNEGDTTGLRDLPDQSTHDSDDYGVSAAALDTYATPSYTLPARVVDPNTGTITAWIKPERPSEFYLTRMLTPNETMTAYGDPSLFDARLIFNAARRTDPESGQGNPESAAYRTYRLYRKAASGVNPDETEFNFDTANPALVAEFDTKGPEDIRHYTMWNGDVVPGPDDFPELRDLASDWAAASPDVDCSQDPEEAGDPSQCIPYIYWLKTAQCTKFDDGIDTSSAELSDASRPFLFPCSLTYDTVEIVVDPGVATVAPNTVSFTPVIFKEDEITGDEEQDCSQIVGARLLAYRFGGDEEYLGSSDWRNYEAGVTCNGHVFPQPDVQQATRGFGGPVKFVVEVSTADGEGTDEQDDPVGCRVRSDYGPLQEADEFGIPVSCASQRVCGSQGAPAIFGTIDEDDVELFDGNTKMRVRVPILFGTCGSAVKADLRALEIKLEKSNASGDDDIPDFTGAQITAGVQASFTLPDISGADSCDLVAGSTDEDAGEDDAGEADLVGTDGTMLLRWRDSFCTKTPDLLDDPCLCATDYPIVLGSAPEMIIELSFAGQLCDVRLTEFNFRVPLEDPDDLDADLVYFEELTCTQRPRRAADGTFPANIDSAICPDTTPDSPPDGPSGSDPDLPIGCTLEGEGRGPATTPEIACGTCNEDCQPCQCPLLDNDGDIAQDSNPPWFLDVDPHHDFGFPFTLLELEYDQATQSGCGPVTPPDPACPFTISEIEIRIVCGSDGRQCESGEALGKLGDINGSPTPEPGEAAYARIVYLDTTFVDLPDPTLLESEASARHYLWTGLSIPIVEDETFRLRLRFDDTMNGSEIAIAKIRFSQPFDAECTADGNVGGGQGPLCSAPSTIILPY